MPGQAAKVLLSERQLQIVLEDSKSRRVSGAFRLRATIILKAFQGLTNSQIAESVALGTRQIGTWRKRWRDSWDALHSRLSLCERDRRLLLRKSCLSRSERRLSDAASPR